MLDRARIGDSSLHCNIFRDRSNFQSSLSPKEHRCGLPPAVRSHAGGMAACASLPMVNRPSFPRNDCAVRGITHLFTAHRED